MNLGWNFGQIFFLTISKFHRFEFFLGIGILPSVILLPPNQVKRKFEVTKVTKTNHHLQVTKHQTSLIY